MISETRSTASTALWLAAFALLASGPSVRAAQVPTALAPVASATPQLQTPTAEPQKLLLAAPAAGQSGVATARGTGRVAKDRPVTFLFQPESGDLFSIGVSSPQNAARISIYLGESTQAAPGTSPESGAIRWSTEIQAGEKVKIVVHTAGAEIPFGVEVKSGPGGV
jgi:hypothetical protein